MDSLGVFPYYIGIGTNVKDLELVILVLPYIVISGQIYS